MKLVRDGRLHDAGIETPDAAAVIASGRRAGEGVAL